MLQSPEHSLSAACAVPAGCRDKDVSGLKTISMYRTAKTAAIRRREIIFCVFPADVLYMNFVSIAISTWLVRVFYI
jgi:hypothetical protein